MKQRKNIILILVGVVLVTGVTSLILVLLSHCAADGSRVCFIDSSDVFMIEENASLRVQVESEALKDYLETQWNTLHPEHQDALEIVVRDSLSLEELQTEGFPYDVNVTAQTSAAFMLEASFNMGNEVVEPILSNVPSQLQDASNATGVYFVPNSIKGWLFVYNKTYAEELGFDLSDDDASGLPDIFDTWEGIFERAPDILEHVKFVFPLTFVDQESFYPFLTGGRWLLNFTNRGSDPGFSSSEFLNGLSLIQDMSQAPLTLDDMRAEDLPWLYEEAFYNRETLFTIATDWMSLDTYTNITGDEYVYAPFPSYNGTRLSPMGSVDGYVISSATKYPSASAEVIRILREPQAATYYSSSSEKTFVLMRYAFSDLNVNEETLNLIRAYSYSDSPPVMTLDDNPAVLSRLLYQEVDIMDVMKDLFDFNLTPEEAQAEIVKRSLLWIEANTPSYEP